MIIGVPKEIKNNENRVALTPAGAKELVKRGHSVYIQHTAGEGSGFPDSEYEQAGAQVLPTIEATYEIAEMIMKVKEPIEPEYKLIKEGQLLFTYFHFASYEPLTKAMVASKSVCLAYETVEKSDKSLPLLVPMSEVAGRMAVQKGANYLEKPLGGRGILLPGTVLVDVAVDQGGCIETCKPTTHQDPTFIIDDVVHYCVANMPGAVPYTSTLALTNATLPYAIQLAEKGWKKAAQDNPDLVPGLNVINGDIVYQAVAEAFDMDYTPVVKYLAD